MKKLTRFSSVFWLITGFALAASVSVYAATSIGTDITADGTISASGSGTSTFSGGLSAVGLASSNHLTVRSSNPILTISDSRDGTWSVGDAFGRIDFASDDLSSGGFAGKVRARIAALQLDIFGASQGLAFYTTRIVGGVLSEQMRLNQYGDLTLSRSTTTPLGPTIGGGKNYLTITGTGGNGTGNVQLASSMLTSSTGQSLGNIEWHNLGASTANSRSAYINVTMSGTTGASVGSFMAFATEADGADGTGSERMRIDSNGNVGIGVTVPISKLHVTSGASATTTVNFGTVSDVTSFACFNTKNTAGADISFYFVGTTMVVENNSCR